MGTPRWQRDQAFADQLVDFACMPVCETTIKQQHARVTLSASRAHIGLAHVSLSNRMLHLERTLRRNPDAVHDLLSAFDAARSIPAVIAHLNLGDRALFHRHTQGA